VADLGRWANRNTKVEIAKTTLADIEKVAEVFDLYRVFYGQQSDLGLARRFLSERLDRKESEIFHAVDEKLKIATGFTQIYPSFSSIGATRIWILNDLYVRPEYRGQNIAKKLIHSVHLYAAETKAAKVVLSTAHTNLTAQALYESIGYKPDLQFKAYAYKL
jgi:ribosomal protein S18 acetylase RimI-like enzyme